MVDVTVTPAAGRRGRSLKIGYVPYSADLSVPGDRRRFPFYAHARGIAWEHARPGCTYDLVILSSKADLRAWRREAASGLPIVYELIDTQLTVSRAHPRWLALGVGKYVTGELSRPALNYRTEMEAMCRAARAVVCSTPEQRVQFLRLCPNVHVILDIHEEMAGVEKVRYGRERPALTLAWEGLPYTLGHLAILRPVLTRLRADGVSVRLLVITDPVAPRVGRRYLRRQTTELLDRLVSGAILKEWERSSVATDLVEADIGVIPIDLRDPLARGKPENKLLIMWRLGLPVVTSATPAYSRCMREAGLDLACETTEDWYQALQRLAEDEELRSAAGRAGAAYVRSRHSTTAILDQWDRLIDSAL